MLGRLTATCATRQMKPPVVSVNGCLHSSRGTPSSRDNDFATCKRLFQNEIAVPLSGAITQHDQSEYRHDCDQYGIEIKRERIGSGQRQRPLYEYTEHFIASRQRNQAYKKHRQCRDP